MNRRVFISDANYSVQYAFRRAGEILYFLQTNKTRYRRGERVRITLVKINVSNRPISLRYSSGQKVDFWVTKAGRELWRWSEDQVFTQALQTVTLQPGESETYTATWDQKIDGRTASSGIYRVNAWNLATRVPLSVRIVIGQPSTQEFIQLPGYLQDNIPIGSLYQADDDE